jgi:hypothetical protein
MKFYNIKRPHPALGGKPHAVVYWQAIEQKETRSAGAESSLIYAEICLTIGE